MSSSLQCYGLWPARRSVHEISQARILEWVAMPSLVDQTQGSNPYLLCLLHWQAGSLPLAPPGGPLETTYLLFFSAWNFSYLFTYPFIWSWDFSIRVFYDWSKFFFSYKDLLYKFLKHSSTSPGQRKTFKILQFREKGAGKKIFAIDLDFLAWRKLASE